MKQLLVIFNGQVSSNSMGGGDKIVMHLSSNILSNFKVTFLGCPEGRDMLKNHFAEMPFFLINTITAQKFGLIGAYLLRILLSPLILFVPKDLISTGLVIWSASDFLPDTIPAWVFKLVHPQVRWMGNMFLVARNPFKKETSLNVNTVLSFVSQRITLFLYKNFSVDVLVLCNADKDFLLKKGFNEKSVYVVSGGIDVAGFQKVPNPPRKMYDACFVGRFHPQKGLEDLLNIWQKVTSQKDNKDAVLAIIGWGSKDWTTKIENRIKELNIEKNVKILGFLDGEEKIKVIKASKMLLFPSTFESWGVVIAEGLACGIPVIAYKIPQIAGNFKKGVVWVEPFDSTVFEKEIETLLNPVKTSPFFDPTEIKRYASTLDWKYSAQTLIKILTS